MKMPWSIKKKDISPSDDRLDQIKAILFPPMKLDKRVDTDSGREIKFNIDFSVDSNVDAVLLDLEEGYYGDSTKRTLTDVVNRLIKVRRILDAYSELDSEAEYLVVDDMLEEGHLEDIIPKEN